MPDDVTKDQVLLELNTDFSTKGLSAQELTAIVAAWQNGALSRDSMLDLFRRGGILPDGRTNEQEEQLVGPPDQQRPGLSPPSRSCPPPAGTTVLKSDAAAAHSKT